MFNILNYHLIKWICIGFLSAQLVSSVANVGIADRVRKCSAVNNLDMCLGQLLEDIKPRLTEGIPELNIPILEPITLQNLSFVQKDAAVNIRAVFKDVFVVGFSNFTLDSLKANLDTSELRVRVSIPSLRVSGKYFLDGNLLLLPITGNGPFRAVLLNIDAGMISKIVIKTENGVERLGVQDTKIDFQLQSARARLSNLFNGDPILGETVNHFINNNDQMILKEVRPLVSRDIALLIEELMDSALSALPVSLLKDLQKSKGSTTSKVVSSQRASAPLPSNQSKQVEEQKKEDQPSESSSQQRTAASSNQRPLIQNRRNQNRRLSNTNKRLLALSQAFERS